MLRDFRLHPYLVGGGVLAVFAFFLTAAHMDIRSEASFSAFYTGKLLAQGDWQTASTVTNAALISPLYVLLLALLEQLSLPSIRIAVGLSIAAITIGSLLMLIISEKLSSDATIGLVSGMVYLLMPMLWITLGQVDALALLFVLLAVLATITKRSRLSLIFSMIAIPLHVAALFGLIIYAAITAIRKPTSKPILLISCSVLGVGWLSVYGALGHAQFALNLTHSALTIPLGLILQSSLWVAVLMAGLAGFVSFKQYTASIQSLLYWSGSLLLISLFVELSIAASVVGISISALLIRGTRWIGQQLTGVPDWALAWAVVLLTMAAAWQSHNVITVADNETVEWRAANGVNLLPSRSWDAPREAGYWLRNNSTVEATFFAERAMLVAYFSERQVHSLAEAPDYLIVNDDADIPMEYEPVVRIIDPRNNENTLTIYQLVD